jgi:hypothetical protein
VSCSSSSASRSSSQRKEPKHDRVTSVPDGNEAEHPILGMSMRLFSSVSKDIASASSQDHIQVFATHSRLRPLALHRFLNVDFAGCRLDRKSTSGTCQFLSSCLVSWPSSKQSSVAQSTTEAEYVAASSCSSQLLWITYTMSDLGGEYTNAPLQCDSTSVISVAKNPVLY